MVSRITKRKSMHVSGEPSNEQGRVSEITSALGHGSPSIEQNLTNVAKDSSDSLPNVVSLSELIERIMHDCGLDSNIDVERNVAATEPWILLYCQCRRRKM